jgi:hypothetical protein
MIGHRIQRDEQSFVQATAATDWIGVRLLGEHVQIVVGRLEGDQRTNHMVAVRSRNERGEPGGALAVTALALSFQCQATQNRIGYRVGFVTPLRKLTADAWKN